MKLYFLTVISAAYQGLTKILSPQLQTTEVEAINMVACDKQASTLNFLENGDACITFGQTKRVFSCISTAVTFCNDNDLHPMMPLQ